MPETGTVFSIALRGHVQRRGTIAQACKATGINRQQFNKYLAGDIMPGTRTLRKICSYLGVSEAELMAGQTEAGSGYLPANHSEIDLNGHASRLSGLLADALRAPHRNRTRLQPGFYRAYFPVRGHANLVARWLVQVTEGPNGAQFHSCRNRFQDGPALGFAANRIRYRGPVTYGLGEAAMVGTAFTPQPLHGIISVNLQPVVGQDYHSAVVLTRRPTGPIALTGVLQFLGENCAARCALSGMGIARLDDPATDPVVVHLMRAAPPEGGRWMQASHEKNLRNGAGGSHLPEALAVRRLSV